MHKFSLFATKNELVPLNFKMTKIFLSPHVKKFGFLNLKILLVEAGILGDGIQNSADKIWNHAEGI